MTTDLSALRRATIRLITDAPTTLPDARFHSLASLARGGPASRSGGRRF